MDVSVIIDELCILIPLIVFAATVGAPPVSLIEKAYCHVFSFQHTV